MSCVAANSCKAVGSYQAPPNSQGQTPDMTLVESWNGTAWSVQSSPNKAAGSELADVSCVSASSCTAVGLADFDTGGGVRTLVESWNGANWSVVVSPNPAGRDLLSGVSCLSASSCKAVGYDTRSGAQPRTLIESWKGSAWSLDSSVNNGSMSTLSGVSCEPGGSCRAVGSYINPTNQTLTLIEAYG